LGTGSVVRRGGGDGVYTSRPQRWRTSSSAICLRGL